MLVFPLICEELKRTYVRTFFATHVGFDDVMMSPTHHDNHPAVVINCAKFSNGRPSSFRTVGKNKSKEKMLALQYLINNGLAMHFM